MREGGKKKRVRAASLYTTGAFRPRPVASSLVRAGCWRGQKRANSRACGTSRRQQTSRTLVVRLDQVLAVDLDPPCGASAAPPNCHPIRKTGGRRTYRNALRRYIFLAACVRPTSVGFSRHAIRRESGTRVFEFCPCVASRRREASGRAKETGVEIARDDYSILSCVGKRFCLRKLFAILQIR